MLRTLEQNKRLWSLCNKLAVDAETLQELVFNYSQGRTKSSKALTMQECQALINHLSAINQDKPKATTSNSDATQRMRRKILSICHEMNWVAGGKLDWKRINDFMFKSSYLHKALNSYSSQELPTLVTQFENILKSYYAKG